MVFWDKTCWLVNSYQHSHLGTSYTLKMEAVTPSYTLVTTYQVTLGHILAVLNIHQHHCENTKYQKYDPCINMCISHWIQRAILLSNQYVKFISDCQCTSKVSDVTLQVHYTRGKVSYKLNITLFFNIE